MKYNRKLDYMDYRKSNEKAAITAALWFLWLLNVFLLDHTCGIASKKYL